MQRNWGQQSNVKAHEETDSHRSSRKWASTSNVIKRFFCFCLCFLFIYLFFIFRSPPTTPIPGWNEWPLSQHGLRHGWMYCSFDCAVTRSKVPFPHSDAVPEISCGWAKGEILMTDVLALYSMYSWFCQMLPTITLSTVCQVWVQSWQ